MQSVTASVLYIEVLCYCNILDLNKTLLNDSVPSIKTMIQSDDMIINLKFSRFKFKIIYIVCTLCAISTLYVLKTSEQFGKLFLYKVCNLCSAISTYIASFMLFYC